MLHIHYNLISGVVNDAEMDLHRVEIIKKKKLFAESFYFDMV